MNIAREGYSVSLIARFFIPFSCVEICLRLGSKGPSKAIAARDAAVPEPVL
jgi:hypothetical protein